LRIGPDVPCHLVMVVADHLLTDQVVRLGRISVQRPQQQILESRGGA
jgi:hypothetical protein